MGASGIEAFHQRLDLNVRAAFDGRDDEAFKDCELFVSGEMQRLLARNVVVGPSE